jgi:hypothetical protein
MKRVSRFSILFAGALLLFASHSNAQVTTFKANLIGKAEVPPVDSSASGQATFQLSTDGESLTYTLSVSNIEDVTMAHIHIGISGEAGKPVAPLKMSGQQNMRETNGVIAKGTIRASDLTGPLKGKTIADLVAQIQAGKTYVNVHTKEHPDGEIRGTIR